MAAGDENLESQSTDTYPLLMDHSAPTSHEKAGVPTMPEASSSMEGHKRYHSEGMPSSPPRGSLEVVIDQPSNGTLPIPSPTNVGLHASSSLNPTSPHSQLIRTGSSFRMLGPSANSIPPNVQRHTHDPYSGFWISVDMSITMAQIVTSIIVLSLSRNETPQAPLAFWVIGYATGCLAMLPLLGWKFKHRHVRQQQHDVSTISRATSLRSASSFNAFNLQGSQNTVEQEGASPVAAGSAVQSRTDSRIGVYMEKFKIALDCFFALWFVVGSVWIFGGHTSAHDAPNLYRLCIIFLAFSCISYAMPFAVCATLCCCLPCIIAFLRYRELHMRVKGAPPDVISGLPIYKFKTKELEEKAGRDGGHCSDSESVGEGGIFAPGTDKERYVPAEDAVCCICLGQYVDGVDLKELQCLHFFHVECVDKWLKINATCPLCKYELSGSGNGGNQHEELII